MIRYLQNHQINYQYWDACIEASAQRLVYALSWYLDVVAPGWAALVEEQEHGYKAVMPLPVYQKFGLSYINQPFFCQQLGIFGVTDEINTAAFLALALQKFPLISRYSFNTGNTQEIQVKQNANLQVFTYATHHLDLNRSYEAIYQQYTRDRKINIKRSKKARLQIIQSTDVEPLIFLFKADAAFRIPGGVAPAAYDILRQLYTNLAQRGFVILLYTLTQAGEIDAGGIFLNYGNKIIYLFSAASIAGRRRSGRSLLIDHLIKAFAGQPFIFDFESPPSAVDAIVHVYQGFGSEPVPYFGISYNNLPAPFKLVKKVRQFLYQRVISTFRPKPTQ